MTFSKSETVHKHYLLPPWGWLGSQTNQDLLRESTEILKDLFMVIGPAYEYHYGMPFISENIYREIATECGSEHVIADPCGVAMIEEWYALNFDDVKLDNEEDIRKLFEWIPHTFSGFWVEGDDYERDAGLSQLEEQYMPIRQLRFQLNNIKNGVGPVVHYGWRRNPPDSFDKKFFREPRRVPNFLPSKTINKIKKLEDQLQKVISKHDQVPFWWNNVDGWAERDAMFDDVPLERKVRSGKRHVLFYAGDWDDWHKENKDHYDKVNDDSPE